MPAFLIAGLDFALIGFAGLLVPSLIPALETRFAQTDAGVGVALFVIAISYVLGSFGGGALTERIGRRMVLTSAAGVVAAGLGWQAVAGSWPWFVAGAVLAALGSGALDGGGNALVLDAYGGAASGRLNAAHVGFGLGALSAPLVVGQALTRGVDWPIVFAALAVLAVGFAVLVAASPMPSGRHAPVAASPSPVAGARRPLTGVTISVPFVALALAIATYVSAEIGVSSWLVRLLSATSPIDVATAALGVYWGGIALGRLVAALTAHRIPTIPFAIAAVLVMSAALVAALVATDPTIAIALFGLVGFASGPVYPLIMSAAGERFPRRSAVVAGSLAGVAVLGGVVYPPLIGLLSARVGIRCGMVGAVALGLVCAAAVLAASRARDERPSRTLAGT